MWTSGLAVGHKPSAKQRLCVMLFDIDNEGVVAVLGVDVTAES